MKVREYERTKGQTTDDRNNHEEKTEGEEVVGREEVDVQRWRWTG